jgi:hypothetical protein
MVRQIEQEGWGHFIVRVRRAPDGTRWEIESVGNGTTATFSSPQEMLAFIRGNLSPRAEGIPAARKAERL